MKAFGIILIIAAAGCGIAAFMQTQETELERLTQRLISLDKDALRASKGMGDFIEATALLQGRRPPPRDTKYEENLRDSLSQELAKADRYKAERNQKMLLWLGSTSVCFLAGIICMATAKRPATSSAEKRLLSKLSQLRGQAFRNG